MVTNVRTVIVVTSVTVTNITEVTKVNDITELNRYLDFMLTAYKTIYNLVICTCIL